MLIAKIMSYEKSRGKGAKKRDMGKCTWTNSYTMESSIPEMWGGWIQYSGELALPFKMFDLLFDLESYEELKRFYGDWSKLDNCVGLFFPGGLTINLDIKSMTNPFSKRIIYCPYNLSGNCTNKPSKPILNKRFGKLLNFWLCIAFKGAPSFNSVIKLLEGLLEMRGTFFFDSLYHIYLHYYDYYDYDCHHWNRTINSQRHHNLPRKIQIPLWQRMPSSSSG